MPVMTAVQATFTHAHDEAQLNEHHYISACIDAGIWSPGSDGLGISYFPASSDVYGWLSRYAAKEDGKAPPLELLHLNFPEVVYVRGCGKQWARDMLIEQRRKKGVVEGLRKALEFIREDDMDQALGMVRNAVRDASSHQRAGMELEDIPEDNGGARLPSLYPAIASCGGISEGDYVLILARTNVGKSFRLMQHAVDCAGAGKSVVYLSLEMRAGRCASRMHPMVIGRDSGLMTWEQRSRATRNWLRNRGGSLRLMDDTAGPASTESIARATKPGDIVFVDYIGLMRNASGNRMVEDWHVAAAISNSLRSLTTEHGITVFAGAQANRSAGNNSTPDDLTIAQTDAIGQDIDLGIALQRKRKDLPFTTNSVFKARSGSVTEGRWFTMFKPEIADFSEISAEEAWELSEQIKSGEDLA